MLYHTMDWTLDKSNKMLQGGLQIYTVYYVLNFKSVQKSTTTVCVALLFQSKLRQKTLRKLKKLRCFWKKKNADKRQKLTFSTMSNKKYKKLFSTPAVNCTD